VKKSISQSICLFVWKYLVVCVWEERRESQAKRREEKRRVAKGKVLRILACNFGVEGKFCSFKDWRRGGRRREGGREENLEDEIVLRFFSFLISVSFVINPVQGGGGGDFE